MGPHGNGRGTHGLGNLPFPYGVPPRQEFAGPGAGRPGKSQAEDACEEARQQRLIHEAILAAAQRAFFNVQPSPLEAPPINARVGELFSRKVVAPATAPGDADGAIGAAEMAAAEGAISGLAVEVLTPPTTADFVTILRFRVPDGELMMLHSLGTWGHDLGALRDVVRWRVKVGEGAGRVLVAERELGLLGSLDHPAFVHGLLKAGEELIVECRNLDTKAASLVEVWAKAWTWPSSDPTQDATMDALLPPASRRPPNQTRFGGAGWDAPCPGGGV